MGGFNFAYFASILPDFSRSKEAALEASPRPFAALQLGRQRGTGGAPQPRDPQPCSHGQEINATSCGPAVGEGGTHTEGLLPTDMSLLYSSRRCLLEAMKSPPFSTQPVCSPVSAGSSRLTTSRVWASSSTSTSLGRSCHSRPGRGGGQTHSPRVGQGAPPSLHQPKGDAEGAPRSHAWRGSPCRGSCSISWRCGSSTNPRFLFSFGIK